MPRFTIELPMPEGKTLPLPLPLKWGDFFISDNEETNTVSIWPIWAETELEAKGKAKRVLKEALAEKGAL